MFKNKPNSVQIELVHGCDRRCDFCGTMGFKREFIFIEEKTLKKICSLIKNSEYNPRIILGGAGEPTLHPELLKMLTIIRGELSNLHIQMITNGYWIKKYGYEFVKELLKYVNDVAIDDYDSDIDENSLLVNIAGAAELRKLAPGVSFYAEKNVRKKRVLIIPAISKMQGLLSRKFTNHCGAGMPQTEKYNDRICTTIFRDMIIRCDGNVPICCDDFRCEYLVCNILNGNFQKLEEVWNHPRLDSARRVLYYKHRKYVYPCCVCATSNIREGFLPDILPPSEKEFSIINQKTQPPYEIVKRDWELYPDDYYDKLF